RRALRRGLDNPIDKDERIREVQGQALARLDQKGIAEQRVRGVWQGFPDDYFLRYSVDEIVWHTRAMLKKADDGRALVLARQDPARGGTEVFVYARDKDGIFAFTTAVMDRLGLTILDARIITSQSGYTLDSYTVLEDSGAPITGRARIKAIVETLKNHLDQPDMRLTISSRHISRVLKHFQTPTQISFELDAINNRTMLDIVTSDRPGLLGRIGRAFLECGISLQNAKIATVGARAEDIFFITDRNHQPLLGEEQQAALRAALLRHLENGA
ncbi:MAG: [protein-PII] uridylyltransferase, partial [Gammaproteobacteria bacterium]